MTTKTKSSKSAHKLCKEIRTHPLNIYSWTIKKIEQEAHALWRQKNKSDGTAKLVNELLGRIGEMQCSLRRGEVAVALESAKSVGATWMALHWGAAISAAPGNKRDPVWDWIFRERKLFPRKKPADIIRAGMSKAEMFGACVPQAFEYYQKKYSEMVKAHPNG